MSAAERAVRAGFDGRARFLRRSSRAIRAAIPRHALLPVKLNVEEEVAAGVQLGEVVRVGRMLETDGIDAVELAGGSIHAVASGDLERGFALLQRRGVYYQKAAIAFRGAVDLPVTPAGVRFQVEAQHEPTRPAGEGVLGGVHCKLVYNEPDTTGRASGNTKILDVHVDGDLPGARRREQAFEELT